MALLLGLLPTSPLLAVSWASDINSWTGGSSAAERRAGEVLVKYRHSEAVDVLKIRPGEDLEEVLIRLNTDPTVEYAEPNFLYRASIIPSDTFYENQWYLGKIKAPEAWNTVREAPEITIAIIDTGVQTNHPDLKDNIWRNPREIEGNGIDDDRNGFIDDINGWDFVNNLPDPQPKFMPGFTEDGILHGTIVAGIAAAAGNNAAGTSGIAWRVKIMAIKVLDDKGEGDTRNVVKAVDYAIANGADIINFSFVGFGSSLSLENAIARAHSAGIIIVAAAGNEQSEGDGYNLDETPMFPACHDGPDGQNHVIGVAATDALDQKAVFSSYGRNCVDISAPGVSIFTSSVYSPEHSVNGKIFNKYYDGFWSGTSMATPMVSGAAALIAAVNPGLGAKAVVDLLLNQTDNIDRLNPQYPESLGSGRLNIAKAVEAAKFRLSIVEIRPVVAPYGQRESRIKVTDPNGSARSDYLAYDPQFMGGVNIAAGDVDGDGVTEIITGAGSSGGPHVRVFDANGQLKGQFFAYDRSFRGGVNVAAGDVDGDGIDEIITGAGPGGGPQVRIFNQSGNIQGQFFAYDEGFRGGVGVATANLSGGMNGAGREIVTAPGRGGGPHVKIFDDQGRIQKDFFAYSNSFTGGISLSAGDFNADGFDEIITGAGPGGAPHVRIFDQSGSVLHSYYAFDEKFTGGVSVSAVKINR